MSLPLFDPNFTYLLFPGDTSPSLEPTPGPVEPPLESVYDHCSQNDHSHLVSQFPNISGRKLEYPDSFVPDGFYFPDMPMQSSSNSTDPTNRSPPHVFTTAPHSYRPRDSDFVESWLEPCNKRIGRVCKCLWPHCSEKFVQGSNNAHMHVHKHWGTKPYECATCQTQFSSEVAARRHRDSRNKLFSCRKCAKLYSRRDYRNFHQKRCKQNQMTGVY